MNQTRKIKQVMKSQPTMEGAGVHLKRAFGFGDATAFDPFLLLDDFHSDNPEHYIKGFPWHPHRGIETITYVLHGDVEHGDSMGNQGVIGSGDVQWMTAGSGVIHQEMPKGSKNGLMWGFQLWANLPATQKMMGPRYRDIKAGDIPEVELENGVRIKIICGSVDKVKGPVQDIVIDPQYLDITVPVEKEYRHPVKPDHTAFAYVIAGNGFFEEGTSSWIDKETLVLFDGGDIIAVRAGSEALRYILVSGKPLKEPVAWHGPIVMNTQAELETAFREYREGTFIKKPDRR
ncbi:MAG: pirin family protein [Deltaproteobacteria bacterium]|nr:pirin family protein [Deltaproteobacteria bacterium]MBW2677131.1 pirin family protein [Deltaproteobacteria bacterium]